VTTAPPKTPAGRRRLVLQGLREVTSLLRNTVLMWNWSPSYDEKPDPATSAKDWRKLAARTETAASYLTDLARYARDMAQEIEEAQ
jgi:hypothetical protein